MAPPTGRWRRPFTGFRTKRGVEFPFFERYEAATPRDEAEDLLLERQKILAIIDHDENLAVLQRIFGDTPQDECNQRLGYFVVQRT